MVTRCFRATSQVERVLLLWGGLAEGALKTITPQKKQTLSVLTSLTFSDTNTIQSVSEPLKRQGTDMNSDRVSRNSIHKSITIQILTSKFWDQCFGTSKWIIQNPYALHMPYPDDFRPCHWFSFPVATSCSISCSIFQGPSRPSRHRSAKLPILIMNRSMMVNDGQCRCSIFHGFPWLQLLFMGLPKVFQWASKDVSRFFQRFCQLFPRNPPLMTHISPDFPKNSDVPPFSHLLPIAIPCPPSARPGRHHSAQPLRPQPGKPPRRPPVFFLHPKIVGILVINYDTSIPLIPGFDGILVG